MNHDNMVSVTPKGQLWSTGNGYWILEEIRWLKEGFRRFQAVPFYKQGEWISIHRVIEIEISKNATFVLEWGEYAPITVYQDAMDYAKLDKEELEGSK